MIAVFHRVFIFTTVVCHTTLAVRELRGGLLMGPNKCCTGSSSLSGSLLGKDAQVPAGSSSNKGTLRPIRENDVELAVVDVVTNRGILEKNRLMKPLLVGGAFLTGVLSGAFGLAPLLKNSQTELQWEGPPIGIPKPSVLPMSDAMKECTSKVLEKLYEVGCSAKHVDPVIQSRHVLVDDVFPGRHVCLKTATKVLSSLPSCQSFSNRVLEAKFLPWPLPGSPARQTYLSLESRQEGEEGKDCDMPVDEEDWEHLACP